MKSSMSSRLDDLNLENDGSTSDEAVLPIYYPGTPEAAQAVAVDINPDKRHESIFNPHVFRFTGSVVESREDRWKAAEEVLSDSFR